MTTSAGRTILTEGALSDIHARAATHDRENTFFSDDLDLLQSLGYLTAFVPADLGGPGFTLTEVAHEQERLAAAAPATALATNMHLVWTGVAKTLHDRGDHSLDFVLDEALSGEVFGFGISEAGNDLMLFGSDTIAEPLGDGGYRFTGTKIFTSLSPAWTRLAVHGLDSSGPSPKIVYGIIERGDPGVEIVENWDTMGMRATQSNSTVLTGATVRADRVVRILDPGPNPDLLIFAIFANFELLLASVYTGIAGRAIELAIADAKTKVSKRTGLPRAEDPDIRWRIADQVLALDAIQPQLDAVSNDVDGVVDRGADWFRSLVGVKVRATETAVRVVEDAVRVVGGSSYFSGSELGRLYRDVLAGLFHPSDDESAHATVARAVLGA